MAGGASGCSAALRKSEPGEGSPRAKIAHPRSPKRGGNGPAPAPPLCSLTGWSCSGTVWPQHNSEVDSATAVSSLHATLLPESSLKGRSERCVSIGYQSGPREAECQ